MVYLATATKYLGCLVIADVVKADAAGALRSLKELGVKKLWMLTGDNELAAAAVAKDLGITDYRSGLLPQNKVEIMEEILQRQAPNGKLAFVGDGINDAPVLARADIGIAMGALGSDAAIEAADIVLMNDTPSSLPVAVKIARRTLAIVKQNIVFALGVKLLIMALGAIGLASMWAAVFADVGVAILAIFEFFTGYGGESL